MRARLEPFGAWVALDDGTLVALDRRASARAGLAGGALWERDSEAARSHVAMPLEAHVAVTSRCPVACTGCYQNASPEGEHVGFDELCATLDALAAAGVFTVAFGGGEPAMREDLPELGRAARARGLVPVVTTSGLGLSAARARELAGAFAQVNVSHDGVGGAYAAVRGFEGARHADRAIELLAQAGAPVGVNLVLTRQSFDAALDTADHVRSLGARELQLLRYKPAGRAASADYLARRLSPAQARGLYELLAALSARHGEALSVRIDCAMVSFLSPHVSDPAALTRWGIFGCEAGRHLLAVTRSGAASGCSFASAGASAGRFARAELGLAVRDDPEIAAFRAFVAAPPEPCASCAIRAACRGGCKVVAAHSGPAMRPDPECPRVLDHADAHASGGA